MKYRIAKTTALILLIAALPANADAEQILRDCSQKFLATWLWNRQAALAMPPKHPCVLYGEHDQYICDQKGCVARSLH